MIVLLDPLRRTHAQRELLMCDGHLFNTLQMKNSILQANSPCFLWGCFFAREINALCVRDEQVVCWFRLSETGVVLWWKPRITSQLLMKCYVNVLYLLSMLCACLVLVINVMYLLSMLCTCYQCYVLVLYLLSMLCACTCYQCYVLFL